MVVTGFYEGLKKSSRVWLLRSINSSVLRKTSPDVIITAMNLANISREPWKALMADPFLKGVEEKPMKKEACYFCFNDLERCRYGSII
jgi:hypothetical protein